MNLNFSPSHIPHPGVTAECLQTVPCYNDDDNDNDDNIVLTMLVHVSHAWLGGGGLILIFNCYSPSSSLLQT